MHRGPPRHLVSRPPIVSRLPVSRGSLSPLELSPDCLGREGFCPEAPCVSIPVCLEAPCVSRLPVSRPLCVSRLPVSRGSLCLEAPCMSIAMCIEAPCVSRGWDGVVSRGSLCLDRCVSRGSLSPLELSPDLLGPRGVVSRGSLCLDPCVSRGSLCLEAPIVSRLSARRSLSVSRLPVSRGAWGVVFRGSLCLYRCVSRGPPGSARAAATLLGPRGVVFGVPRDTVSRGSLCLEGPCVSMSRGALCPEGPSVSRLPGYIVCSIKYIGYST